MGSWQPLVHEQSNKVSHGHAGHGRGQFAYWCGRLATELQFFIHYYIVLLSHTVYTADLSLSFIVQSTSKIKLITSRHLEVQFLQTMIMQLSTR